MCRRDSMVYRKEVNRRRTRLDWPSRADRESNRIVSPMNTYLVTGPAASIPTPPSLAFGGRMSFAPCMGIMTALQDLRACLIYLWYVAVFICGIVSG